MLVGSGLLARAFCAQYAKREDVLIHAAGVSNSSCVDAREFQRERDRLQHSLCLLPHADAFVYFSTCSVVDPEAQETPYVRHKLAMESLVRTHPRHLILRLPQVAGITPNPHTLLNFLYARIARSESFTVWRHAHRNIIDVSDVAVIAATLLAQSTVRNTTVNIANRTSHAMPQVIRAMESALGKQAVYTAAERGSEYPIDTVFIQPYLVTAGVSFGDGYLQQVVERYYGHDNLGLP